MDFRPSVFMSKVRSVRPLVHHITNQVTMNDCANVCICAGGSPVMSCASDEVEELASSADALVLNIGTLDRAQIEVMVEAGKAAKDAGKPVILDPVGFGATEFRTEAVGRLMSSVHPDVIKGNRGEISILTGCKGIVRGVDSVSFCEELAEHMVSFAKDRGCILVATGEDDYVTDGTVILELSNGVPMLEKVSGTGCSLSSVIGSYIGACGPSVEAVASAVCAFNVAAEIAMRDCNGPGTFKPAALDALYNLDSETLDERARFRAF